MMHTYSVTLSEEAGRRLHAIAAKMGRTVESLIESAAEEAALDYFRHRKDDPARRSA
jgi:predicted transcriptional regulator